MPGIWNAGSSAALNGFASRRKLAFKDMKAIILLFALCAAAPWMGLAAEVPPPPANPRFSVDYMDQSVDPGADFYQYANGAWLKKNPVPPDKTRWGAFFELQERNWYFIHRILAELEAAPPAKGPARQVRDFFHSAMDTHRLEQLGWRPLQADLQKVEDIRSPADLARVVADFQSRGISACFGVSASPDATNSGYYALYLGQGGLTLPDRDYYVSEKFAPQREAYQEHLRKLLALTGVTPEAARRDARTILELETELARASKPRAELRDPLANYHKFRVAELASDSPAAPLRAYLSAIGHKDLEEVVLRQPEFFRRLRDLLRERPLRDWQTYLRWRVVLAGAPYLHAAAEEEAFAFFGGILRGQQAQEPRWQRAARVIDGEIGEALGQLFVEKHFPPAARVRMSELISNLKAVFRERLQNLDWMSEATRARALAKFDRFTQKIGHPDHFRDYSSMAIQPDDYLGNVQRAERFEFERRLARVGQPVDRSEWHMTPQTVNAYFSPSQNEIVFPAGILQPPFFDLEMDDAVNYGAIGVVIGHEITHGYDDQGRKFDAEGNLRDWWTPDDARAFEQRAQKLVEQYAGYEALPGLNVNGRLTLGENLADVGGGSIAFEALQRALAKDPAKRVKIDGFTPEQRFFLSFAQVWRTNCRDPEMRRLVTVDPHSPGKFRGFGPHVNLPEFYASFGIQPGAPLWREPAERCRIW